MIPDSPYKGLVPFEDSGIDALLFFGRERESSIIAENLLAARLTVLYGPSGVGKSSVLRAGVAHRLRRQADLNVEKRGHPEFTVVVLDVWNEEPTETLRATVREALAAQFGSALLDERDGEPLAETLGRWSDALACDLLLILDQAEEYFLYHEAESGFAVELPELVTHSGLRVRVLVSLRDDALSKLDRFKGRIPNLFSNYLRLDHLDRDAAREAVVRPVERFNELTGESIEVEPALVEEVLDQTAAGQVDFGSAGRGLGADEAPAGRIEAAYLQLVLERLWQEERAMGSECASCGDAGRTRRRRVDRARTSSASGGGAHRRRRGTSPQTCSASSSRLQEPRSLTEPATLPSTLRSTSSDSCPFSRRSVENAFSAPLTVREPTGRATRSSTTFSARRSSPGGASRSSSESAGRLSGGIGGWLSLRSSH